MTLTFHRRCQNFLVPLAFLTGAVRAVGTYLCAKCQYPGGDAIATYSELARHSIQNNLKMQERAPAGRNAIVTIGSTVGANFDGRKTLQISRRTCEPA
jgi:hypothetical protein